MKTNAELKAVARHFAKQESVSVEHAVIFATPCL